ncbi:hypothetical protein ACFYSF_32935 [Streptomyces canus]|uniref:hypothetical protein n=1 Tax=Streptomyces TaxID=1883 RepID=UPI000851EB35|nr:hypothetical protein [Streptomyces sp. LUP47B]
MVITYPDRGNTGLRRTVHAPTSAASGVVEDGVAMYFAGTAYGKHLPRRENLAAAGGRAEFR